ncbi:MAG: response regulator [Calditrichota bacterium]
MKSWKKTVGFEMAEKDPTRDQSRDVLRKRNHFLETQVKHLTNDLNLTKEEYEQALQNYFDLYSDLAIRSQELKKLQRQSEQKSRELQTMLDASPALIFYKDTNLRFIRVNQAFADTLCRLPGEIIGSTYEELFPGNTDHGQRDELFVLHNKKPVLKKSVVLDTAIDSRELVIDKYPYLDAEGNVIGIISFALDLTDLRKVQEEKQNMKIQLAHAQKMESISILADTIAHDFNNLLGIIRGYTQLAYAEVSNDYPINSYLEEVIASIGKATTMTRMLMDYAKPGQYEFAPNNVYQIAEYVIDQLRELPEFNEKMMTLRLEGDKKTVSNLDTDKIEKVFYNMGKNAIEAITANPMGEVVFHIEPVILDEFFCRTNIHLTPGQYVAITVSDNGKGIEPVHRPKIFDPFFTTKQVGEGAGLGLSYVYSIIQAHKGHIEAESVPGAGTTFTIYLMVSHEQWAKVQKYNERKNFAAKNHETVLIVEDTEQMRELMVKILTRYGYRTQTAENGLEGVKQFEKTHPEVVILNVRMPEMDGVEALRILRKKSPDSRIILSTGSSISQDELSDYHPDEIITKPYDPISLVKSVRTVLDEKFETE